MRRPGESTKRKEVGISGGRSGGITTDPFAWLHEHDADLLRNLGLLFLDYLHTVHGTGRSQVQ
jgi:hypothetical protein